MAPSLPHVGTLVQSQAEGEGPGLPAFLQHPDRPQQVPSSGFSSGSPPAGLLQPSCPSLLPAPPFSPSLMTLRVGRRCPCAC